MSWKGEFFNNNVLCDVIQEIIEGMKNLEVKTYNSSDSIYALSPGIFMGALYIAYENTFIPTEYRGAIGILNGDWIITTNIETKKSDGKIYYEISYVFIEEKYTKTLENYFKVRR